ncbi:MAG: hypothetical protein A4E62_00457 [Syntrophorhabdus sp. PtaU1.Bin002]|nr:MAG: hypothetical protein A4E58_00557 [Syntrophorhabdus sp. PtaB.Bin006]OPY73487.1 MAG: hypothetical protein A4E62_00457 [Syntrophorhabdus sp. PtaU1.Bin002]
MEIINTPVLVSQKTYAVFDGRERRKGLAGLCADLLSDQKRTWSDCRQGYEFLRDMMVRDISCGEFSVRLQHNPGRIKSTLADVREEAVNDRPCFLCLNHLPERQKGILYRNEYLILCNPMPVFPFHFTVSRVDHRPQAITGNINTLLQLAADFGSDWTVLYNGPRCGASAPDHLHFQVVPAAQMPVVKKLRENDRFPLTAGLDGVLLHSTKDLGREIVILEADNMAALVDTFDDFLRTLKEVLLLDEEPMINVAVLHADHDWRLLIFPRRKHRPEAFFRSGDDRIAVSPAVIEMGGVLVTPFQRDFERLDEDTVKDIYCEVSLEGEIVQKVIECATQL